MITDSKICSKTADVLILPTDTYGEVKLNISSFRKEDVEHSGYKYLSVFVGNETGKYNPIVIQGKHRIEGNYLVFSPHFPFERGLLYVVRIRNVNTEDTYQSFRLENNRIVDSAKVVSIYPSGNELPENLLRFYIYFNTPMKNGQALKYIQLKDANGEIDAHAFMEFKQELWSPDGKRLTVLFDPGRVKRGVSTNMEFGPALTQGNQYYLVISGKWQDIYGQELHVETRNEFKVGEAYRNKIEVSEWQIREPNANSHDGLCIQFHRMIDHALLQLMLHIEDKGKSLIAGNWKVSDNGRLVQFIPEEKWKKGEYYIMIDHRLEDVAGNNLDGPLDQVISDDKQITSTHQIIDFSI